MKNPFSNTRMSQALSVWVFATIITVTAQRTLPSLTEADVAHLKRSLPAKATATPFQPRRVLIYNFTRGVYHDEAIAWATQALELMGEKTGAFTTTTSVDAGVFTPERLREFDAVVMNNTMLNVFGPPEVEEAQMRALVDFVRGGKGLVGIHSASVWEKDPANPTEAEFRQLIGGRFRNHPWESEPASIRIEDPAHPLNAAWGGKTVLPLPWRDELFQFEPPYSRDKVRVLVSLDLSETTDKGQRPDKDYPLAWIQTCGKGRSFYSALGHNQNAFRNPTFLRFLQDGVQFALGDLPANTTPVPQPKTELVKAHFMPACGSLTNSGLPGTALVSVNFAMVCEPAWLAVCSVVSENVLISWNCGSQTDAHQTPFPA